MRSRTGLRLAGVVLAAACGSRTGLPGGAGGGGAGSSSGGPGGPLAVKCTAALQDGAPTPTSGYCPTRANQAPFAGPRAPRIVWTAQPFPIQNPEYYFPARMVVDAAGRSYVAVDASPLNPAWNDPSAMPNRISALSADGATEWSYSVAVRMDGLSLGLDGTLWAAGGDFVAYTPDGKTSQIPTAPAAATLAIGSDGTFFLESQNAIARATSSGQTIWQSPGFFFAGAPGQIPAPIVVTPADGVVVENGGSVTAIDANGRPTWQASAAEALAADANGNAVLLQSSGLGALALVTIGPAGDSVRTVSLGSPQVTRGASQIALAGDGTDLVLLADEVSSPGLTKTHVTVIAIDASGATRWTTPVDITLPYDPADLSTHYGIFVDAGGTVVVTAGSILGIDLASGSVAWTLQAANPHACLRPAVLGSGGAILATQCDGTVFLARDP